MKLKKLLFIVLISSLLFSACSFENDPGYTKYSYEFLGTFDTVVQIMGYARNSDEFETMAEICQKRFVELNKLFDIYNDYDGINNIKTINDNAGIKPVEVQQEIIDLLMLEKTGTIKQTENAMQHWALFSQSGMITGKEALIILKRQRSRPLTCCRKPRNILILIRSSLMMTIIRYSWRIKICALM